MPWSFSAPEAGVLIGKIAQLLDKIRPRPVKFSPAVVPAFFELGGGEPSRARTARTSVLERAATTPPIPVNEPNPSRPTSLTFCGRASDSAVNLSTVFDGGEFQRSEIAIPQLDSVVVVLVRAGALNTCGMEVAEPRGGARRRLRLCRSVRTMVALYASWGGVAPLERGR
jgi:hypothetical protein